MFGKLAHKTKQTEEIRSNVSNPINTEENETLKRLTIEFKDFVEFFDKKSIDSAVEKELGKNYPTISLSVKERLFNSGS